MAIITHRFFIFVLLLISISQSQHFETFDTGIQTIPALPYNYSDNTYRKFSCESSRTTLATNGSFVFSILSFNYFFREAFCLKPFRNPTSWAIIVSCSSNVYRLSYMFFQKGPNIFLYYGDRIYSSEKNITDMVDITKWMTEVQFPLKSLLKTRYIFLYFSTSKQYQIVAQSFITGISLFQNSQNISLSIFKDFGKVKMETIYLNITIDDEMKLQAPVGVRISTSSTVEKVSFYSLIVIKEMISMNMNFETVFLEKKNGIQYMGFFAGISQMSFFLSHKQKYGDEDISLDIDYNYKPINISSELRRFSPQKQFLYSKGVNLNIKYSKVSQIFYRRCLSGSLHHLYPPNIPKEGQLYKIMPAFSTGLVWEVTPQGKIKLAKQKNTNNQFFYFMYQEIDGIYQAMIFSAMSNQTVRSQLSNINDTLRLGRVNESDYKGAWILRYAMTNNIQITYIQSKRGFYRIGPQNSTVLEGVHLIQGSSNASLGFSQQFLVKQVHSMDLTTTGNSQSSTSAVSVWKRKNFNTFIEIALTASYASSDIFSYYSIEEQKCYDRGWLDSQLLNKTLNNFHQRDTSQVLPYFMDINKTLSAKTLLLNANTSLINTSTLQFAQGYLYGLCIDRYTLNSFFTQIRQGWTGFAFNDFNKFFGYNVSNHTAQSETNTKDQNKQEEKPLILMPNGCQKIKIVDISLMQYECEVCQITYVLHSPSHYFEKQAIQQTNQTIHKKICICSMGYFMNQTGHCTQCTSHPTNCKPQIKIQASLQNQFSTGISPNENRTIVITFEIMRDQYDYIFMSSLQNISNYMVAYINGFNHRIKQQNLNNCTKQESSENTSLCLNIRINDIKKSNSYTISVSSLITSTGNPTDSYLLINETEKLTDQLSRKVSRSYLSVASNQSVSNDSVRSQQVSKLYFSKIQTYELVISEPFTTQKFATMIEPFVSALNYSSSFLMIAAPFLMDKISIYSLIQTNSLLYMMSFLKFNQKNQGKLNQIQSIAKKLFIFRPEPFINPFSLESQEIQPSAVSHFIQLPIYETRFQRNVIYNQSLSSSLGYPQHLYKQAISSLNNQKGSQNYMTLSLNVLVNMGIQILLMEVLIFSVIFICSTTVEKKPCNQGENDKKIKKKIEYNIKRHRFVNLLQEAIEKTWEFKKMFKGKQEYNIIIQKPIQWLSMPELKDCEKITIIQDQKSDQAEVAPHEIHEPISHSDPLLMQQERQQPSFKQNLLFFVTGFKRKRFIFYSSFLIIQFISQSYLLYFQLVKPLDPTSNQTGLNLLNYFDSVFGIGIIFFILIFPVILINYEPLHMLKIVAITSKLGGYTFDKESDSLSENQKNKSSKSHSQKLLRNFYTYEQIFLNFCLIYYEIILIPFSIAIGSSIFYQTLPIALYQVFKLYWLNKRLKILDKIKIVVLFLIFGLSGSWDFIEDHQIKKQILSNTIIWGLYIVIFIELAKMLKFIVVFLINTLRLKINLKPITQKERSQKSKKLNKQSRSKQKNEVSILEIQEQKNFNFTKQLNEINEFDSEQHMIEKQSSIDKKKQRLEALKQKSVVLNEIAKVRQNLRENLEYMRNRRKRLQGNQENMNDN